ncbi:MAG: hypothetical protein ACHQU0_01460 [Candidatus Paceibacteria bacterium]
MKKQTVLSVVRWLRMFDNCPENCEGITVEKFFEAAYTYHYGSVDLAASIRIEIDLEDFYKYGHIPIYVVHMIRKVIYPDLISAEQKSA